MFGFYNSTDDRIVDQQLQLAKRAGIQAMISSWDGPGYFTDTALQHILARSERVGSPYQNMRWSIYYEQEGYGDPSVSQIASDLQYLQAHFFGQPGWLWVNGKPVVFVYSDGLGNCSMADRWIQGRQQSGVNVYLVLQCVPWLRNMHESTGQLASVLPSGRVPLSVAVQRERESWFLPME